MITVVKVVPILLMLSTTLFAQVASENIVGYRTISLKQGWQKIGIDFNNLGIGDDSLLEKFFPATIESEGDMIAFEGPSNEEIFICVPNPDRSFHSWVNAESGQKSSLREVTPGTSLWYFHRKASDLEITISGEIALNLKTSGEAYSAKADAPPKLKISQEELADIAFTSQALKRVFDLENYDDIYGSVNENSYLLQFPNKRVLAVFQKTGSNEYRLYDLDTGEPVKGRASDLIEIWSKAKGEAQTVMNILAECATDSFFGVLPHDKLEVDRRSHPVRAFFVASIMWMVKHVSNLIVENFIVFGIGFLLGRFSLRGKKGGKIAGCTK